MSTADSSAASASAAPVLACCRCNKSPAAKCGLCKAVAYCGKVCQAKDWELGHKARCKELRKEQAAAGAANAAAGAAANGKSKASSSSASASASMAPPPSSSPAPAESTDLDSSPSIDLARPSQWLYAPALLRDLFDPRGAGALTIPRRPVGLRNPKQANSCFLNVVLQSLTYTAPLANFLEQLGHTRDSCVVSKSGKYCALCALDSHHHLVRDRYAEALSARAQSLASGPLVCKPILPVEILKNLSALNADYQLGQQEDSQETTKCILHVIEESWRKNAAAQEAAATAAAADALAADASAEGSADSSSAAASPAPVASPAPARHLSQRTLETTPISQLFGGYLLSQLRCGFADCNRVSSSFEHFLDLSLELIEATDDLGEMLEAFSRIERLDERNKWKCGHCQRASRALKKISIFQQPNILMIQLKRFRGGMFGKVNKSISFPAELSLRKYMSECVIRRAIEDAAAAAAAAAQNGSISEGNDGVVVSAGSARTPEELVNAEFNTSYRLYAVIVHLDLLAISSFGHYICYVRGPPPLTPSAAAASSSSAAAAAASPASPSAAIPATAAPEADWFKIDDDEVTRVSEKTVLAQKAYILFYQRSAPFVPRDDVAPPEPTPSPAAAASAEEGAAAAGAGSDASSPTAAAATAAASTAPVQCVGGCGFWGSLATESMCSSCYRKAREDRGEIPRKASPAPQAQAQANYERQSGQTMEALRSRMIAQRVAEARAHQDALNREKALALMTAKIKADADAAAAAAAEEKSDGFYKAFGAKQRAAQAEAAAARAKAAEAAAAAKEAASAAAAERRLADLAAAREREEADLAARLDKARITDALRAVALEAEASGQATKQCSACHQWQVVDLYTNAQLKKQGKRVCTTCVEKKAAAAAAAAASKQTPAK